MKVWQDTGWDKRLKNLQGVSMRVLWHLISVSGWNNMVPGPTEVSKQMDIKREQVSKAYGELLRENLLMKTEEGHQLNPLLCWKGRDNQYEEACRKLSSSTIKQINVASMLKSYEDRDKE